MLFFPYKYSFVFMNICLWEWKSFYNERYQWQMAKLSPNEYYEYITTGIYPLKGIVDESKNEQMFPETN